MTIGVTSISRRIDETQQVVCRAILLDMPAMPLPAPGGRGPTQWRPMRVTVRWVRERINGDLWDVWRMSGEVTGPKLKRDGTASANDHSHRMFGYKPLHTDEQLDLRLAEWIESTWPGADLPEPIVVERFDA